MNLDLWILAYLLERFFAFCKGKLLASLLSLHKYFFGKQVFLYKQILHEHNTISWGCRIHWLHLYREVDLTPNECSGYDIKQYDGKAPGLEIWRMCGTPSWSLLPEPLWLREGPIYRSNRTVWLFKLNANKWLVFN